jgi:tetratricopeptide (TPR) repeat protein
VHRSAATALVGLLIVGCATDINRINASRYYNAALAFEMRRQYEQAREAYWRALVNYRSAGGPQNAISAATYNLGRMTGLTCNFLLAEQFLQQALQLEEQLPTPEPGNITKRLGELANISFALGKFEQSVHFYERALPRLEQLGIIENDPVGYGSYLDGYANALEKAGMTSKGADIRGRANALRDQNTTKTAKFLPLYYHNVCAGR